LDDLELDFHKALDRCFSAIDPLKPLGLSVDLDAFPQSVSPGVSAPSPRGLSLEHVVKIIDAVAKNLTHVGFYELNPHFDCDEQSARLGAFLLSRLLQKKFS
ncbi:MAG: arginase family protein, partial [Bdellovibrionota bacterium]